MKKNLNAADFMNCINQRFTITFSTGLTTDAVLTEVSESSSQTYSVILRTEQPTGAPQGIHILTHEKLGTLSLFLVPVSPCAFEAVFNFIKE